MTLVFESDRSGRDHFGFTVEWDVYDRPRPTPPPPAESKCFFLIITLSLTMKLNIASDLSFDDLAFILYI